MIVLKIGGRFTSSSRFSGAGGVMRKIDDNVVRISRRGMGRSDA